MGGQNLNGYNDKDMALFFLKAGLLPNNIIMERGFYHLYKKCKNQ